MFLLRNTVLISLLKNSAYFMTVNLRTGLPWWHSLYLSANEREARYAGLIPGSGRSPGGRHGNPLQYSCLENLMGRGAWRVTFQLTTRKVKCLHPKVKGNNEEKQRESAQIKGYLEPVRLALTFKGGCWWGSGKRIHLPMQETQVRPLGQLDHLEN